MKYRILSFIAATTLVCAVVGGARAQLNLPAGPSNYEEDLQLFAPFEIDLDNGTDDQWSGYFFEYNKLFWSYTGERTTIGSPDAFITVNGIQVNGQFAEVIYRDNPQDEGDPPPPYVVTNTIDMAGPRSKFAMGDRYELGYRDNGHGWNIGILDGPEQNQREFYGFVPGPNGELPPFIDPDYTGPDDVSGPGRDLITASPGLRAFGWGSVPVVFETPAGYLTGFRDYLNLLAGATLGTQAGPMLYVGNYGLTDEVGTDDDDINFFRLADDIDEDGFPAAGFIIDPVTGQLLLFTDFDDLHEFNVFFDNVTMRSQTQVKGVETMWTHDLTNTHYMAKHQNNRVTIGYGARFMQLYDDFQFLGEGSILGRTFYDTTFTNNVVGPQIQAQWTNQRQRWRIEADARAMFGYNIANWRQQGVMGEELIPGALNRPLYARPTAFSHGLTEHNFSPVGELRLNAKYQFTRGFSANFGYTSSVMANIKRAATSVRYRLPDFGYVDSGSQTLLSNGFDFGVEFVH
jgi:hypothetical protein